MSTTTTERSESTGIVGDALRRPIQDAVKEGVKEAMQEQEEAKRSGRESGSEEGGGRSKFALLALLGIGMAAFMLWRRRSDSGGGMAETIREKAKTGGHEPDAQEPASGAGAIETTEESVETEEEAPEASSE